MSTIREIPMIQKMLDVMSTAQVSSLLGMINTPDSSATNYVLGTTNSAFALPSTLAMNPQYASVSFSKFYLFRNMGDTPSSAELRNESRKITGCLYQPTADTLSFSFIEFGKDICHFWSFINGQAILIPETLSTVELRGEILKRELQYFSTAISCDAQGNVEIGRNLKVDGDGDYSGNLTVEGILKQNTYELDVDITISGLPTGLHCNYAHARVSNGKLNIVAAFYVDKNVALTAGECFIPLFLTVPTSIGQQLYPVSSDQMDFKRCPVGDYYVTSYGDMSLTLGKTSNTIIYANLAWTDITASSNLASLCRFEFNFILS